MNLVVKNTGLTLARDVMIEFDPPLENALFASAKAQDSYHPARLHMFTEGIPTLPPGKAYSLLLDAMPERYKSDLPRSHVATVRFSGSRGPLEPLTYVLDFDLYFGRQYADVKSIHHLAKSVDEIAKTLKKWTAHLNGLRVYALAESDEHEQAGQPCGPVKTALN